MRSAENKRVIKRAGRVSTVEGRKNTKKKVTANKRLVTNKEEVGEVRTTARRVGRPAKKATANRRGRPAISSTEAGETQTRGRPVSLEVLQRRLTTAEETLKLEREKRKKQLQDSRLKLAESATAKKELLTQVRDLKKELVRIKSEKSEAERAGAQQAKMESARAAAVEKFVEKWNKKFLEMETGKKSGGKRRKRGRPRGS